MQVVNKLEMSRAQLSLNGESDFPQNILIDRQFTAYVDRVN